MISAVASVVSVKWVYESVQAGEGAGAGNHAQPGCAVYHVQANRFMSSSTAHVHTKASVPSPAKVEAFQAQGLASVQKPGLELTTTLTRLKVLQQLRLCYRLNISHTWELVRSIGMH